jgi:UDP-N-acetyl-D-mannosaminuronate dehydrogenase
MSIAYHPITNGQTERTNQSLEQYLRHYVNNTYSNWVSLLSMTQLALNAKGSNTTKVTPFFANYGREFNLFEKKRTHLLAQSAIERVETLKRVDDNISKMQERSTKYQNEKRKTTSQLKERDKIYLFTKNLKTRKLSKKLNHVKVESFLIKKAKRSINYELDLPKDAKVFLIFHVSLLESVDPSTPI